MKCTVPIAVSSPYGDPINVRCGQCKSCRIRRQAGWSFRNIMEFRLNSTAAFVTLTYSNPMKAEILDYRDIQLFLKRLRKNHPTPIRYFCVGEYGAKSGRGHWHLLIYGLEGQEKGHWLTSPWQEGYAYIGQVTEESIRYTARYCLKFGEKGQEAIMRASVSPAIGETGVRLLSRELQRHGHQITTTPTSMMVDGKYWPLDRTMQKAFKDEWLATGGSIPERSILNQIHDYVLNVKLGDPVAHQNAMKADFLFQKAARSATFSYGQTEI